MAPTIVRGRLISPTNYALTYRRQETRTVAERSTIVNRRQTTASFHHFTQLSYLDTLVSSNLSFGFEAAAHFQEVGWKQYSAKTTGSGSLFIVSIFVNRKWRAGKDLWHQALFEYAIVQQC